MWNVHLDCSTKSCLPEEQPLLLLCRHNLIYGSVLFWEILHTLQICICAFHINLWNLIVATISMEHPGFNNKIHCDFLNTWTEAFTELTFCWACTNITKIIIVDYFPWYNSNCISSWSNLCFWITFLFLSKCWINYTQSMHIYDWLYCPTTANRKCNATVADLNGTLHTTFFTIS